MHTPPDPIRLKSDVLASLRERLHGEEFVEVVTPVVRRADLGPGRRIVVDMDDGRFLRAMIGPALRTTLEHHPRVFEIGPCFRPDKPDELHATEFTMLDLYAANESYEYLCNLAIRLVTPHITCALERLSVAEHIRGLFGIDLRQEPLGDLPQRIAVFLGIDSATPFKEVLGRFIEQELEPLSSGGALLLNEFPVGGEEPCARLKPGTPAVLNRFELIVDGIEVVHGYEDEVDTAAFTQRARAVGLYDDEQRMAQEAVEAGRVPAASVGLGIGIERLCAAAAGTRDIRPFLQSSQF
ncbi:amino acid--tRNA ligase-related protein [Micromonospora aurantiaca (nom. illeg.)]|uniref:amino acid--tRNA ligase-related protein n=1 Tax=Micromonospora aurantiaca (nom. illeg.) TaxID=47850 RepID=UPI0034081A58